MITRPQASVFLIGCERECSTVLRHEQITTLVTATCAVDSCCDYTRIACFRRATPIVDYSADTLQETVDLEVEDMELGTL